MSEITFDVVTLNSSESRYLINNTGKFSFIWDKILAHFENNNKNWLKINGIENISIASGLRQQIKKRFREFVPEVFVRKYDLDGNSEVDIYVRMTCE